MAINGVALAALAAGSVFTYSALHNDSLLATVKDVISGKGPTPGPTTDNGGGAATPASGTPASTAPVSVSGNVGTGKLLASAYGWGSGAQWNALYALWERESGWDNLADNPSSGAYGIPQALPRTKMPALAQPPVSSAIAQIGWGLTYIKGRYGDPVAAWAHEESYGWY